MSTLLCCCGPPPNVCNCTWPRVLSYVGQVGQAAAAFYFANSPDGGLPEPVYTLTWGTRPSVIPKELQLLFYSYTGNAADPWYVTMPDEAWFSGPIAAHDFGIPTTVYFYMWMQSCQANVMVIDAPYGAASTPGGTKGAGNNVISYFQTQCNPQFQMKNNLGQPPKIYGNHAGDDIVPNAVGGAGLYINGRIGTTYPLQLKTLNPTTGLEQFSTTVGHNLKAVVSIPTASGGGSYTPPPGGSVTWGSTNTAVFTVAGSGSTATVTPVAAGTADVTAAISGDPDCTTTSLTKTVTVT